MNQQKTTLEKDPITEQIIDALKSQEHTDAVRCTGKKKATESKPFSYWLEKNHYYHYRLKKCYRNMIPEGMRVLALQCKNGYLLDAVKPSYGVGVDTDLAMISEAKETYGRYQFYHGTLADIDEQMPFDYIILSHVTEVHDVQALFESLKPYCHTGTRIIIDSISSLWQPFAWCAQKLGLCRPLRMKHRLHQDDIVNVLYLAQYQAVHQLQVMLMPAYLPIFSTICNTILVHVPLLKHLCMHRFVVARPLFIKRDTQDYTVSVIIPCNNEKATLEAVVSRMPQMGKFTELIFVDGHSTDGTFEEMKRVMHMYPEKSISIYKQKGKGKGDAVRLGFEYAIGDIVMILDAGLSVPPEELPKFYYALTENKGECINGSRLEYNTALYMMPSLFYLAHRLFSKIFSWLLNQPIKDALCGTKVLWKDDYQMIMRNRQFFDISDTFGDFGLLQGAAKLHIKIIDIPIHYKKRATSKPLCDRLYEGLMLPVMSFLAMKRFKFK